MMKPSLFLKSILIVIGFLIQSQGYSQDMYLKSDTYVYVSNQYVFIKRDLELSASTSNFYLRNGGQLLQGTTGPGVNKGLGSLSVFQEGTVNNYTYNYWCSPVGGNVAAAGNSLFSITQLGVPTTTTATTPATMLPLSNLNGTSSSSPSELAIAPYWIWKFSQKSAYADWIFVGTAADIAAGEGFTMKGVSGTDPTVVDIKDGVENNQGSNQRYDFRGKPNDGTITIPVLADQLTLTGNPYPSAINLSDFLTDAANCTGIAYFWEQDKSISSHRLKDYRGGYGSFSPVTRGGTGIYIPADFYAYDGAGNEIGPVVGMGNNYEREFSPIGQGFMIEGNGLGATVEMNNTYREFVQEGAANNSQFERKGNNKTVDRNDVIPQIRFNTLLDNTVISQMVLAFDPNATDGMDHAKDAKKINNSPANNYFVIDNIENIIEVVPFDIDKKIAIGFRNADQANYKITVNEMKNIPEVTNVYLHDKIANIFYDIKNDFIDLTLPAGNNNTQYEITFKNARLSVDGLETQNFVIQQDNVNKNLIINNPMQIKLTNCSLYDVVGKLIFTKKQLGTNTTYLFSTSNLSDGIYIVKLESTGKIEMGRKIIVKN